MRSFTLVASTSGRTFPSGFHPARPPLPSPLSKRRALKRRFLSRHSIRASADDTSNPPADSFPSDSPQGTPDGSSLEKEFSKISASINPDVFFNQAVVHQRPKPFHDQWVEGPRAEFGPHEALEAILGALRENAGDDSGIQVLYRFADIDPWTRSRFFGRSFDLGQFERFRRIMHSGYYAPLLNHRAFNVVSALEADEDLFILRVEVTPRDPLAEGQPPPLFQFTLRRRVGGRYDGFVFLSELLAEGIDWRYIHTV